MFDSLSYCNDTSHDCSRFGSLPSFMSDRDVPPKMSTPVDPESCLRVLLAIIDTRTMNGNDGTTVGCHDSKRKSRKAMKDGKHVSAHKLGSRGIFTSLTISVSMINNLLWSNLRSLAAGPKCRKSRMVTSVRDRLDTPGSSANRSTYT